METGYPEMRVGRGPVSFFVAVLWRTGVACSLALTLGACNKLENAAASYAPFIEKLTGSSQSAIVVQREVLILGRFSGPQAIVGLPDGGFAIVGDTSNGWLVRTDANGKVLWSYDEFTDRVTSAFPGDSQAGFKGVIAKSDGSIVVCATPAKFMGELVYFNSSGRLTARRDFGPVGLPGAEVPHFDRCVPWGDGYAVLGGTTKVAMGQATGYGWVLKFDANDEKEFEVLDPSMRPGRIRQFDGHDLIIGGRDPVEQSAVITRINEKGEVANRVVIPNARVIYGLQPTEGVGDVAMFVVEDDQGNPSLLEIDDQFVAATRRPIERSTDVVLGRGYVFPDKSLALFGFSLHALPSVSRTGPNGIGATTIEFPPTVATVTIRDAVPISAKQFVAVADRATASRASSGIVLLWVKFK